LTSALHKLLTYLLTYISRLYSRAIFIVGVPGNLLVLAVVIWKLSMSPEHHAMTIFVGSLAVSDLGLLLWVTWRPGMLRSPGEARSKWVGGENGSLEAWGAGIWEDEREGDQDKTEE